MSMAPGRPSIALGIASGFRLGFWFSPTTPSHGDGCLTGTWRLLRRAGPPRRSWRMA